MMTKPRKPDEPAASDEDWGTPRRTWPTERAAAPAEHPDFTLPTRGVVEVLADIDTAVAGLTRLSPSGVETAASQLAALVGELRGMVK